MFLEVASLALGQSYNCPTDNKVALETMGIVVWYQTIKKEQQNMNYMHNYWDVL